MKIDSAPAAIVHPLIIEAAVMTSHSNSLTQVSTDQRSSAKLKPNWYISTIAHARDKNGLLLLYLGGVRL
ncbi:MAG: hypothetical protein M3286_05115 [Thermoproteota archaeon]|nr:hypothetical protein [Thermoproteota archaeon]